MIWLYLHSCVDSVCLFISKRKNTNPAGKLTLTTPRKIYVGTRNNKDGAFSPCNTRGCFVNGIAPALSQGESICPRPAEQPRCNWDEMGTRQPDPDNSQRSYGHEQNPTAPFLPFNHRIPSSPKAGAALWRPSFCSPSLSTPKSSPVTLQQSSLPLHPRACNAQPLPHALVFQARQYLGGEAAL